MYERGKEVSLESSVGLMVKNLQVVSFDSEWLEIYLGTVSLYNHNHNQVNVTVYIQQNTIIQYTSSLMNRFVGIIF